MWYDFAPGLLRSGVVALSCSVFPCCCAPVLWRCRMFLHPCCCAAVARCSQCCSPLSLSLSQDDLILLLCFSAMASYQSCAHTHFVSSIHSPTNHCLRRCVISAVCVSAVRVSCVDSLSYQSLSPTPSCLLCRLLCFSVAASSDVLLRGSSILSAAC